MEPDLTGRTALVTGSSQATGAATASGVARAGGTVGVNGAAGGRRTRCPPCPVRGPHTGCAAFTTGCGHAPVVPVAAGPDNRPRRTGLAHHPRRGGPCPRAGSAALAAPLPGAAAHVPEENAKAVTRDRHFP